MILYLISDDKIEKMKKFSTLFSAAMLALSATGSAQTIMLQDFESATIPALPSGWTQNTKATTGWKTNSGSISFNNGSWILNPHTTYAVVDDWNHNETNDSTRLVSPVFSLVGHTNAYVAMDYFFILASYGTSGPTESAYLQITTNGGTSWTTIDTLKNTQTIDWRYEFKSLAAYAGQPTVQLGVLYNDGNGGSKKLIGCAVDYIKVYEPVANDLRFVTMTPMPGSPATYGAVGAQTTFGGTVVNYGTSAVSSFDASYQDGTSAAVTGTVSASVASNTAQTFSFSTAYTFPSALGAHGIKGWITEAGDADHTDDTATISLTVAGFKPKKKLCFEEGTGAWCGFCPRGAVYMDSIANTHGSDVTQIAVHDNSSGADNMVVTAYDQFVGSKIGGFPNVLVDRREVHDPSALFDVYDAQKDYFGFADLTLTDMGAASFGLSVKVSVKPAVDLTGDYRLALVLVENNVHGPAGSGWDQHNYYYHQESSYGVLVGAGHDWNNEGVPRSYGSDITGDNMYYQFVARAIVPSPTGASGSLPATMTANSTYDYTFNTTVNQPFNRANMKVVAMLINNADGSILNSNDMVMPLGISNIAAGVEHLTVYPNPATDVAHLNFNLNERAQVSVLVLDALGRVVSSVSAQQFEQGAQKININTANLASGVYTIKLQTEKGSLTQQLSIAK